MGYRPEKRKLVQKQKTKNAKVSGSSSVEEGPVGNMNLGFISKLMRSLFEQSIRTDKIRS